MRPLLRDLWFEILILVVLTVGVLALCNRGDEAYALPPLGAKLLTPAAEQMLDMEMTEAYEAARGLVF